MKQGTRRTRAPKLDTGIDAEIAAAEAKLKSLREAKKENERKYLERNQKAILALLSEHELDRVPVDKWKMEIDTVRDIVTTGPQKDVSAKAVKYETWVSDGVPVIEPTYHAEEAA